MNLFNKVYMSILFLSVGSKIYSLFYLYFLAAFKGFPAKASSNPTNSEVGSGLLYKLNFLQYMFIKPGLFMVALILTFQEAFI